MSIPRTDISSPIGQPPTAGKSPYLPRERINVRDLFSKELQRVLELLGAIDMIVREQLRVEAIINNRDSECVHVSAQLMFLPADRA